MSRKDRLGQPRPAFFEECGKGGLTIMEDLNSLPRTIFFSINNYFLTRFIALYIMTSELDYEQVSHN